MSKNIYPLTILKQSIGQPILVEIKSGDTYNGILQQIDKQMNIKISDVTFASKNGQQFYKMPEIFIKGNALKYFQLQPETVGIVIENEEKILVERQEQIEANKKIKNRGVKTQERYQNKAERIQTNQERGDRSHSRGKSRGRGGKKF